MHSSLPFQLATTWNKTGRGNVPATWTSYLSWSTIWDILQLAQIRSTTFSNSTNASPSQSYITLEVVESGNGTRGVRTIFEGWLFARSIVRLRLDFPSSSMFLFRDIFVVGRVWTNFDLDLYWIFFLSFFLSFFSKFLHENTRYFHSVILLNNYYKLSILLIILCKLPIYILL